MPCLISIDAGTPIVVPTSPFIVLQGTNYSTKPIRLKRIQLQSNQNGATQQVVAIQLGTYTTASSTGGTVPTAIPVDSGSGYTPVTTFRAGTATMGTTFANREQWQWNTAIPFDIVEGLESLQDEFQVSKVWALIIPVAPGASFSLTGTVNFEEFG